MKHSFSKKITAFILALSCAAILMSGCGKMNGKAVPELSALSVDSTQTTGAGITVGSTFDEFMSAYGEYQIQKLSEEGEYTAFAAAEPEKDMPYETADVSLMVSGFYVDEKPTSTEELKEMTGADISELSDALASSDFLKEHKVIFKYVLFTVQNNVITDIAADYLDYNEELY